MQELTLVSTNPGKLRSLERVFGPFGIGLKHVVFDLPELQTTDLRQIAEHKVRAAYERVGSPVLAQDSGFFLDAWKGFPGPFVKFATQSLGEEGFIALVRDREKTCAFRGCLAYYDGVILEFFEDATPGTLSDEPRGVLPEESWGDLWRIFTPLGYCKTLAEMSDAERAEWRANREKTSAIKFAEWYSNKEAAP